ncbi:uncharacterized protein LOC114841190 [Diachasma alloeum]|uniref:Ionotropic receptor 125 n=1 Tax=Diachasma alloeum TaxID=454923 RepID=A0A4E0S115_9HYME|nr:uncharacterized protein LOC114841190 [Diachasma alloeum]THK33010.1 ionotropic receptor 125 [Diachasma alloeum]
MKTPWQCGSIEHVVIVMCIGKLGAFNPLEPVWLKDLLHYIEHNDDEYHQVIFIASEHTGTSFENYWIQRIQQTIMATYPTIRLNVERPSDADEWSYHGIDATSTLLISVDDAEVPRLDISKQTISVMKKLSLNKKRAKYLIIFLSSERTQNFSILLRYGWKIQMMDLVILEIVSSRREMITISESSIDDHSSLVIHYFNPFLNLMVRKPYEPGIEWFPNLMSNMHGYPLKIGIRHQPPFSEVTWDEKANCVSMSGWDITVIQEVAAKMNFTLQILPQLTNFSEIIEDNSSYGLFNLLSSGKVDILASVNPHYTEDMEENLYRSEMIFRDQLCAVIPVKNTTRILFPTEIIEAFISTIGILSIFWVSTLLFKFRRSWSVFDIFRMLFGIPKHINHSSLKLAQRLMIKIILIVSLFYCVRIYACLTEIIIDVDHEVEIENFDDLDRSGLIPVVSAYLLNRTFGNVDENDRALINLKNKAVATTAIWDCPSHADRFKNVTCLMTRNAVQILMKSTYQPGERILKISKACFWSDSYSFLVRSGSPIRKRMDYIINLLSEVGLKIMWFRNDTRIKLWEIDREDELIWDEMKYHPTSPLREQLTIVALFGFTTATITFIGELLWYHWLKKWKKTIKLFR